MADNETAIFNDYKQHFEDYDQLDSIIADKLNRMIKENNFFIMEVNHRVKSFSSLRQKLAKKKGKYSSRYDITDLCGVRIICYFSDTVDEIAAILPRLFDIDILNSIDKRVNLQANEFGYMSLHFICSLKDTGEYDPELCKLRFEIQIRTVLQHAWAEIEHDLGYKNEFGVPRSIRREFSRVASLLEVADMQFVGLRESTDRYIGEVREKIANGQADDLPLDQITLKEYLNINKRYLQVVAEASRSLNIDIIPADVSSYLNQLDFLGVKTVGDLVQMFRRNQELTIALVGQKIRTFELDIISTGMILRYLCRAELISAHYSDEQIQRFTLLALDGERAKKSADRIIAASREYWGVVADSQA